MQEFGGWYFDLARRWDGTFSHQGPPEPDHDSYEGWDATGGYLLAYAMPLKRLHFTGRRPAIIPQLDAAGVQALILDGRGWDNKDRKSAYDKLSAEQILERLGSWSPVVRERAAMALGRRKEVSVSPLVSLLESGALHSRYGACQALVALGGRGAPAIEPLRKALADQDLWLRIKAAEALAAIGAPAMPAVPQLLKLLAQVDPQSDPRGMQQRYLSFALFNGGGMLSRSLEGVDREALYEAVRAGLKTVAPGVPSARSIAISRPKGSAPCCLRFIRRSSNRLPAARCLPTPSAWRGCAFWPNIGSRKASAPA
jgi:hypothetical protein